MHSFARFDGRSDRYLPIPMTYRRVIPELRQVTIPWHESEARWRITADSCCQTDPEGADAETATGDRRRRESGHRI
jgi:hypothetical protein